MQKDVWREGREVVHMGRRHVVAGRKVVAVRRKGRELVVVVVAV